MMASEVFFGNHESEEANIAYSILKSTMKVSIQTKDLAVLSFSNSFGFN